MRLLWLDIEEFRSIKDATIPADGLVILFGPNSSGKTTVLEAVEQLLTEAEKFRQDPADPNQEDVYGSVTFDLPRAGETGSPDEILYRRLLVGDYNKIKGHDFNEVPWSLIKKEDATGIKDLGVAEISSLLADALKCNGSAGTPDDRALLAGSLLQQEAIFFTAEWSEIHLCAHGPSLPEDAMNAARRISAAIDSEDSDRGDVLWSIANHLVSEGTARIAQLASGVKSRSVFPRVIVLDGDFDSLAAELQGIVPVLHDQLWNTPPEKIDTSGEYEMYSVDFFPISERAAAAEDSRYNEDPWLEGMSEDGQLPARNYFPSLSAGGWYRVRPSIYAAAEIIAAEANKIAPSFVAEQGTIEIEVLPVSYWGNGVPRVRAAFDEDGEGSRDLSVLGVGTARWVAAAIRLACGRLLAGHRVVVDSSGTVVTDEAELRRIVTEARKEPFSQSAVRLEPSNVVAVYIVDEPEAHLHPAALNSVRQWLIQLAATAATVMVATHSVTLLNSTSSLIRRVLVTRKQRRTCLQPMTGAMGAELARVADDLGLSRGELLLMTKLALFVEGPHDQIILDEWFGEQMQAAGIRIFPVHGVDNLPNLVESEVIEALEIRIATLSDETSIVRASSGAPETRGERAIDRLLSEAARKGIRVRSVGLSKLDILWYLDETVCQRVAPSFPGWAAAQAERNTAPSRERGRSWKKWIERKYNLPLTRESISGLARICREEGKIPIEIQRKIHELIVYAKSTSPQAQ